MTETVAETRARILALVEDYYRRAHIRPPFVPGRTRITYSGRVYDHREMVSLVGSALDFWLTAGPYAEKFESAMKTFFGSAGFLLVNSGSSANLLLVATLCAPSLRSSLRDGDPPPLAAGDEVITPAVTFPTTLGPLVQNQLVPVFVDCEVGTYNVNPALLEEAVGPRTRALFVPHTVGIPCDMETVMAVARRHNLWVLEDGCDALGATFDGRLIGTFGALSSVSFFPAHHITMGEGGGVAVNDPRLKKTVTSLRDWGRDCWCDPGKSNTCGRRFEWELGDLPKGYDHKYTYSNIGYNLKATDMQAAVGLAQVDKIERFVAARRHNFGRLFEALRGLEEYIVLPRIDPRANPSPFGFPVTVRDGIDRNNLVRFLEDAQIETRLVFGGNILRQPGFRDIHHRVSGDLSQSNTIMRKTFFVGVYPGLTDEMVDYVAEKLREGLGSGR
jgi:CDP-6-deoxy-D-xylo-4-hexulose-3-dehydrase